MANVKQQAENCIALFKGNSISTIERSLKTLSTAVRQELCSKFNCSESELASKMCQYVTGFEVFLRYPQICGT